MLSLLFYVAGVGLFVTLTLLGPILVALLANEISQAVRFGFYLLIGGFMFGAPMLAIFGRLRRIPRVGRLIMLVLIWVLIPILAAVPIHDMTELSLTDSLFEAYSSFTTNGSTTLNTVEIWPQSMLFWRSLLQWLGGYFAIMSIILVLAPMGVGGITSRRSSFTVGASFGANQERLAIFSINLGLLYAGMTALCTLVFFLSGTRAFYALTLAMSATSTGGFLPFDDDVDQIVGLFGQFNFAIFLMIGATSVFWHRMIIKGNFKGLSSHRESYSVLLVILFFAVMFVLASISASGIDAVQPLERIVQGLFNASSLVATSGVQSQPGYFTLFPLALVLFIILIGGSAFSTSGGLKHYRIGGMLAQSWGELDRLVYPNIVGQSHFGTQRFNQDLMKAIWSFFVATILVIGFGTIFIATTGVEFEAALTATIATFATAGPVYSAGWSSVTQTVWPAFSDMQDSAKLALITIMVLGRLEIIAVISLFSARYWRNR